MLHQPVHIVILAKELAAETEGLRIFSEIDLDWKSGSHFAAFVGGFDSGAAELTAVLAGYDRRLLRLDVTGSFQAAGGCFNGNTLTRSDVSVGYVGPDPADQIVGLSVDAELAWASAISRHTKREDRPGLTAFLDALSCEQLRGRRTSTLSSGERQRLALASMAMGGTELLILDQCFSALDVDILSALSPFIASRATSSSDTWIVCAPQHGFWRNSERVARLDLGKIVWNGDATEGERLDPCDSISTERCRLYHEMAEIVSDHCKHAAFSESLSLDIRRVRLPSELGDRPRLAIEALEALGGQMLALQGQNGSGKSSLLSALIGLERSRKCVVDCHWESAGKTNGTRICYLPADGVAAWIARPFPAEIREDLFSVNAEFTTRILEEDRYKRLEGGNYRRRENPWRRLWWITSGILADAPWLLLDEPTTGMDHAQRECLIGLLESHSQRGGGGLIVSHDADFLARCCQKRVVLTEGSVREQGWITPETSDYR